MDRQQQLVGNVIIIHIYDYSIVKIQVSILLLQDLERGFINTKQINLLVRKIMEYFRLRRRKYYGKPYKNGSIKKKVAGKTI
ncbi:MAG: hypothetical protein H6Q70_2160 [Firmicutes bacterium]|nr:hypothetical protein [Bacillota bacterium]